MPELLEQCLASLRASEHPAAAVVVENASGDESAEMVGQGYPEARLLDSPENLGFTRGNNL